MTVADSPSPSRPEAAIAGAGIAGLSAAVALRRAGWDVEVFERSKWKSEIGAAITVAANATRVLDRWGFDFRAAGAVLNCQTRVANAADLEVVGRFVYDGDPVKCWSLHRVDLHTGLRELALGEGRAVMEHEDGGGGEGKGKGYGKGVGMGQEVTMGKVVMRRGCEVQSVDCEAGIVRLKDGTEVKKDLVVIADGAHSRLVESFLGHAAPVRPTGRSIYRWLVPLADVTRADPVLAAQFADDQLPGFLAWADARKDVFWASYTCRHNTVLNNAVVHDSSIGISDDENEDDDEEEDGNDVKSSKKKNNNNSNPWNRPASKRRVLETLENFHPAARKIVSLASEDGIKVHRLFARPPLASFVRGRAVIVGDAAHAMMPTHAAGGAMAIETAGVLEVVLFTVSGVNGVLLGTTSTTSTTTTDNNTTTTTTMGIDERLRIFDRLRVPRCNLAMLASNAGPAWLDVPGLEEEIRRFYKGPLPGRGERPWGDEFREVLFGYDGVGEAEKAMRESGGKGKRGLRETPGDDNWVVGS
ncbi:FAD/NAD(P)-binding domain-containing protein [Xylariomycetidae sp. FL2044]|nr:FAD/NAD(P)-binding domain-containing protein [Xylariomycetidae sp. FL2044]